jgi:hypothetical protein
VLGGGVLLQMDVLDVLSMSPVDGHGCGLDKLSFAVLQRLSGM